MTIIVTQYTEFACHSDDKTVDVGIPPLVTEVNLAAIDFPSLPRAVSRHSLLAATVRRPTTLLNESLKHLAATRADGRARHHR